MIYIIFLLTHPVWDVTYSFHFYIVPDWFLLTHPVWDVTWFWIRSPGRKKISTHTSRVGCDSLFDLKTMSSGISTHTSRVGCDFEGRDYDYAAIDFDSHIPCGMWRALVSSIWFSCFVFLLTHPVWDVTISIVFKFLFPSISTHTSRVGCDMPFQKAFLCCRSFLLTHPVWDVTIICQMPYNQQIFLLTHPVWDVTIINNNCHRYLFYFYSHIPCGMWHHIQ